MKKKNVAALMAAALTASMLAGCGSSASSSAASTPAESTPAESVAESEAETTTDRLGLGPQLQHLRPEAGGGPLPEGSPQLQAEH